MVGTGRKTEKERDRVSQWQRYREILFVCFILAYDPEIHIFQDFT